MEQGFFDKITMAVKHKVTGSCLGR